MSLSRSLASVTLVLFTMTGVTTAASAGDAGSMLPDDTETATTWHFGYGDKFDKGKLKTLPVGSVYTEPGHAPHFAMTDNEPVIVLLTGNGPTDTIYENPADDPTNK